MKKLKIKKPYKNMKDKFTFREAKPNDLKDILGLNFELFKKEYREFDKSLDLDWTHSKDGRLYFKRRIVKDDGFVEMIENNKKIIGYLCGGISRKLSFRKEARYAELENMFIDKEFRGKGLGSKLTKDFLKWCKKNKVDYVSVTASAQNKDAIQFYGKQGIKDYNLTLEKKINN